MIELPEQFVREISGLPGVDGEAFVSAMQTPPSVSVKLNRRKCCDVAKIGYGSAPERVLWCESGFYLDERPKFTLNPLLHAGLFYVQDASSMIHETLVGLLLQRYEFPADMAVLDLCAAPGGKTTSMINAVPDGTLVVANEVMPQRVRILRENLLKWGYPEIIVTGSRSSDFARVGERFHIVAVDAPCSGEGMMRKDEDARRQWSHGLVAKCASLQREILADAVEALMPGGFLIYSTCTFNPDEDERNVKWLIDQYGMESVDPELPAEWGIGREIEGEAVCMRFMPHLTRGEGLFAAILRKPGAMRNETKRRTADAVRKSCRVVQDGIPQTELIKGRVEVPCSESVLATDYREGAYPEVELDEATALSYLRHEALRLDSDVPRGYVVVKYHGHPLGLVKNIGNRANNLYPTDWRIRNL